MTLASPEPAETAPETPDRAALAGELEACAFFVDGTRRGELVDLAHFTRHRTAAALREAANLLKADAQRAEQRQAVLINGQRRALVDLGQALHFLPAPGDTGPLKIAAAQVDAVREWLDSVDLGTPIPTRDYEQSERTRRIAMQAARRERDDAAQIREKAEAFINERVVEVALQRESVTDDEQYWRREGRLEARRQLAYALGWTVPQEPRDQTHPLPDASIDGVDQHPTT